MCSSFVDNILITSALTPTSRTLPISKMDIITVFISASKIGRQHTALTPFSQLINTHLTQSLTAITDGQLQRTLSCRPFCLTVASLSALLAPSAARPSTVSLPAFYPCFGKRHTHTLTAILLPRTSHPIPSSRLSFPPATGVSVSLSRDRGWSRFGASFSQTQSRTVPAENVRMLQFQEQFSAAARGSDIRE